MHITEKYIVDEHGKTKEVVIPIEDFIKIEELLGWDLDDEAIKQLKEASKDRANGTENAYVDLDSI